MSPKHHWERARPGNLAVPVVHHEECLDFPGGESEEAAEDRALGLRKDLFRNSLPVQTNQVLCGRPLGGAPGFHAQERLIDTRASIGTPASSSCELTE